MFFGLAAALLVLNLLDGMITLAVVYSGVGIEANPLMAAVLSAGPVWFMLAKTGLVSLGVLLLWRLRHCRAAGLAVASMTGVYTYVFFGYHIESLAARCAKRAGAYLERRCSRLTHQKIHSKHRV